MYTRRRRRRVLVVLVLVLVLDDEPACAIVETRDDGSERNVLAVPTGLEVRLRPVAHLCPDSPFHLSYCSVFTIVADIVLIYFF